MGRLLLLTSSIISLFTLSWCLSRWLGEPQCINSTLLSKVIIEPQTSETRVCSAIQVLISPPLPKLLVQSQLSKRIERLEAVKSYLDHSGGPIQLVIQTQLKNQLSFADHTLVVSADLINTPGLIERALLFMRLQRDTIHGASLVSDFLWTEMLNGESLEPAQLWLSHLKGLTGYCSSKDVLLAHLGYCQTHIEFRDSFITDTSLDPAIWSLSPIFVNILKGIFHKSSLAEKERILNNLVFLADPSEDYLEHLVARESIQDLDSAFFKLVSNWLMPLSLDSKMVAEEIKPYLFRQQKELTYVVVGRSARNVFPLEPAQGDQKISKAPMIVEMGRDKYFFPSDISTRISRDQLRQIPKSVVYVSCQIPEVESLLSLDEVAAQVIFIKQCEADQVDWEVVAQEGVAPFLRNHPEVEFIEFNISALRVAKHLNGPLANTADLSSWKNWLKWESLVLDDGPSILRPLAVIEGVRRFRVR